jgi:hypothetical protein
MAQTPPKAVQNIEADHERPPSDFSSFWKPQTSKTITPQRAAAPSINARSMIFSNAITMEKVSDPVV